LPVPSSSSVSRPAHLTMAKRNFLRFTFPFRFMSISLEKKKHTTHLYLFTNTTRVDYCMQLQEREIDREY
jgi:hypothetical protein